MAIRVSHKSFLVALLLILFISSPTQGKFIANIYIHTSALTSRVSSYIKYNLNESSSCFLVEYQNILPNNEFLIYKHFDFLARSLREVVRNRTLLVVEKSQESRKIRHEGGGSDVDGLMDMDYNSANKKRPIHNR